MKNEEWVDDLQDELTDNELDELEPTATGDEAQLYEHFRVVVDKGQEMVRVDKYLFDRIQKASRNRIQKAADAGFVLANGRPVKCSYRVKPLDVITLSMDRPPYENDITPEDIPLDIVYEDDDVLVVNKPAGLVVHPGHGNWHGTLVNAIAWHLKDNPRYDANDPHVGLVHRIDKDTSGLLVVAKTPDAKTALGNQFLLKTTRRRYRALVWGIVEQDEGTVIANIGRDPKDRMLMTVLPEGEGRHAVTHYRVLERLGYVTLVECVGVCAGDGAHPPDSCPHEAHRAHSLQRPTLRGPRNTARHPFRQIQTICKQLLRHLSDDAGLQAPRHGRGDGLHLPHPPRHDRADRQMARLHQ